MGLTRLGTWKLERKRKTGVTGSLEMKTFRTPKLEACTVQGGVPSGPGLLRVSELGKGNRNSKNRSYGWATNIKLCSAHE